MDDVSGCDDDCRRRAVDPDLAGRRCGLKRLDDDAGRFGGATGGATFDHVAGLKDGLGFLNCGCALGGNGAKHAG